MSDSRAYALSTLAVVTVLALPAHGQSVISTRSGVVHYFEGAVYLAGEPLAPHLGKFPSMAKGAELRTAQGRAEVLLTPGVFLRMGEGSAIRMVANELSDTRVELLAGLAIVDSAEPSPGTSVTLIYRDWNVRFPQQGIYRIDSEPPRLWVHQGKAEVSAGTSEEPIFVEQGMDVPFAAVLVPERSVYQPRDALDDWAEGRQQSISADDAIAENIQDPGSMDTLNPGTDTFTYFPMLGIVSLGSGFSSASSYLGLYQPGFNSIYLPGYTYRPLMLGLVPGGFRTPLHSPFGMGGSPFRLPLRVGGSPSPLPRVPVPLTAPARPVPHVGGHVGVHR
jgi:hypothetical protein